MTERADDRLALRRAFTLELWALAPALLAVGVFLVWGARDGGYAATLWYPGALFLLALLAVVLAATRARLARAPRLVVLSLGLFAGFVAWAFLSISWADVKGDAWDGANRTLLYFTVFALFALLPLTARAAAAALASLSLGIAAIGVGTVLSAARADDVESFFTDGRFSDPIGYSNANAALFLAAFWPALFLGSRREIPVPVRGVLLGAATVLLELAMLPQSRGSLFAFPAVLAVYIAVVPGRVRSLLFLVPVAGAVAAFREPLVDLYGAASGDGAVRAALDDVTNALALSFLAVFAIGTVLALLDRRVDVPPRAVRAVGVGVAVLALVAAGALLRATGNPVARASAAWADFKSGYPAEFGGSRFTGGGLGSNRYDFWRVAALEFRDAPVTGIGADNFAVPYFERRRSGEEPRYPHSLELMIASQTGAVGAVLFGGFLLAVLAAVWRARTRLEGFARALPAAALVAFAYWFAHGSADWFWEIPALGALAFAALGIAAGASGPGLVSDTHRPNGRRVVRAATAVAAVAVAGLAAVSYALPWLAAKEVKSATRSWRADPARAFDALERARKLNFLSDRPDLFAGAIASRVDDRRRMRAAFLRALERNPKNWYALLELAVADALDGKRRQALRHLDRAEQLNPSEPVIDLVRSSVKRGKRPSPQAIDRIFLERFEERTR